MDVGTKNYDLCRKFSYFSFRIFAEYNPSFTQFLYGNEGLMLELLGIGQLDPNVYIATQGYLQSIIRNHLNNMNERKSEFVQLLLKHQQTHVLPLVENLSRANAEIVKDLLTNEE